MAGKQILFTHIKYYGPIPPYLPLLITLVAFLPIISLNIDTTGTADNQRFTKNNLKPPFYHKTPYLFIVPIVVIVLILFKTNPCGLGVGVGLAVFLLDFYKPTHI